MSNEVQAFAMIPVRVIKDLSLSHAEFRAFAAVAMHRHNKLGWAFPSHATLATDLGFMPGPGGAERVRQLLWPSIEKGYLERISGSGRTRSRYRVIHDQPAPTLRTSLDDGVDWS
jgi:hypothetical protein